MMTEVNNYINEILGCVYPIQWESEPQQQLVEQLGPTDEPILIEMLCGNRVYEDISNLNSCVTSEVILSYNANQHELNQQIDQISKTDAQTQFEALLCKQKLAEDFIKQKMTYFGNCNTEDVDSLYNAIQYESEIQQEIDLYEKTEDAVQYDALLLKQKFAQNFINEKMANYGNYGVDEIGSLYNAIQYKRELQEQIRGFERNGYINQDSQAVSSG